MTETTPPIDPMLAAMHEQYLAYVAERDQSFRVQPGRSYAPAELDWILDRLSFWSGVLSTHLDEAVERERRQELGFPLYYMKWRYEIVSLKLDLTERKLAAVHVAPKMTPQQQVAFNDRRIREEVRTGENKAADLMQLKRNFALSGKSFAVVADFGPDHCGAIHPSCGHEITGRCDLKLAHSVVSNEVLHRCSQCGQNFTR